MKNNFFTHKFLPVFAVILYCVFNFCVFSFAALGDNNCDTTALSDEEKIYIKECWDYVETYCAENSISYNYYFILCSDFDYDFMTDDTLIIMVGNSVSFKTNNGGCFQSYGETFTHFYFKQNSDVGVATFALDSAYANAYIYYTNFEDENVYKNEVTNIDIDVDIEPYIANTAEDLATGTYDYVLIFPRYFNCR